MNIESILADLAGWNAERWLVEIIGWTGASLILLAYVLVTLGRLTGRSPVFQWNEQAAMPPAWLRMSGGHPHLLILIGAAGFVVNGWWHGAYPSATLNIVWMLFAAGTLWILWKRKGSSTSAT